MIRMINNKNYQNLIQEKQRNFLKAIKGNDHLNYSSSSETIEKYKNSHSGELFIEPID